MDSSIIVHKDYVVVEHKDVEDEHSELDHKCHEKSDEAWRLCLFVIVVEFKEIAIQILVSHIHHTDQEEVEASCNAVPGNELANWDWEAADKSIT